MDDSPTSELFYEDEDADPAWTAELERRAREMETGEVEGIPWDEVRARLLSGSGDP